MEKGGAQPALSISLIDRLDREPVSHLQRPPLEQDGDGAEGRLIAVCYSDSYRDLAVSFEDDGERIRLVRHACYPTKPASGPNEITAVATRLRAVHSCISKLRSKYQLIDCAAVQGMAERAVGAPYGGIVKQIRSAAVMSHLGYAPALPALGRSRERRNTVLGPIEIAQMFTGELVQATRFYSERHSVYRKLTGAKQN